MQTATKRGSPPRARRGASPHFFGGSPAGAPARQAGGFGVWGRAGPAPPAPGPSRQVRHGAKRPAGAARGKKGARCGAGEKGRCGTGSGRPFVSREKVPKGPAGPAPSPSRQQGRAGKKGKGGISLFPRPWRPRRLRRGRGRRRCGAGPGMCGGGKAGAAGFPRRGMPRRGIGPQKRGGAGGGNPPPALSPFLFAAPLERRRTFLELFAAPFRHREYREGAD